MSYIKKHLDHHGSLTLISNDAFLNTLYAFDYDIIGWHLCYFSYLFYLRKYNLLFFTLDDCKLRFIDMARILKISKEHVGHMVNEYLNVRKVCAKWKPRKLTIKQKFLRVVSSQQFLAIFKQWKRRRNTPWLIDYLQKSRPYTAITT